jgi:Kef-type K+ transport system membrane component KefB
VTLCLGLSLASVYVGMAAIIGAFLAGLALADHREEWGLEQGILPIYEFLGPFFFVVLGAEVNLRTFILPGMPAMLTVICILAVISKLLGCGMIPRGEVGLIVAAAGLRLHVISDEVYTAVVLMSLVTTLIAPPFLRIVMPPQSRAPAVEPPPQQATVP